MPVRVEKSRCNIVVNPAILHVQTMHTRDRHIRAILSKRAKVFPVLGVIGPRQVGKTTFLMHQWKSKDASYLTLDMHEVVKRAKRAPEHFLLSESRDLKRKLVIDEVQKAPVLFDSMKAILDERPRVGIFTVSGSVEFSDKAGVRESLAGRMGICRLYPFTLAELANRSLCVSSAKGFKGKQAANARDIEKWMQRGGMPIFCRLHDETQRNVAIEGWLDAICFRDLQQLRGGKFDGDVTMTILKAIARQPRMNQMKLAEECGVSRSTVTKHLEGLKSLFLIHALPSLDNRRAAPEYVIFDSGVLRYLLGHGEETLIRHQSLRTLVANEIYAQFEYSGQGRPQLCHYRSRGGAGVDLVLKYNNKILGIDLGLSSDIKPYSLRGLKSFVATHKNAEGVVLAPITQTFEMDGIRIIPWTNMG